MSGPAALVNQLQGRQESLNKKGTPVFFPPNPTAASHIKNIMGWDYCVASSNAFAVKNKASFRKWADDFELEVIECGKGFVSIQSEFGWPFFENDDGEEIDIAEALCGHLKGDSVAVLSETYTDRTGSSTTVVAINAQRQRQEGECAECVKTKAKALGTVRD